MSCCAAFRDLAVNPNPFSAGSFVIFLDCGIGQVTVSTVYRVYLEEEVDVCVNLCQQPTALLTLPTEMSLL